MTLQVQQQSRVFICLFCHKQRVTLRQLRPRKWYACEACLKVQGGIASALRTIYLKIALGTM